MMYALVFIKRYEYSFKKELTIKHKDGLSGLFSFFKYKNTLFSILNKMLNVKWKLDINMNIMKLLICIC